MSITTANKQKIVPPLTSGLVPDANTTTKPPPPESKRASKTDTCRSSRFTASFQLSCLASAKDFAGVHFYKTLGITV